MFRLFGRKPKPESLEAKFARLLGFRGEMVTSTRAAIEGLKRQGDTALLLSNYSHLVDHHCQIAVMHWRQGQDPRATIAEARAAYRDMLATRDTVDPGHALPTAQFTGITDWDLVHALFWLAGTPEPVVFGDPDLLSLRYFVYSRHLLHRVTGCAVPPALAAAAASLQGDALVDRDYRDKLALLDGEPDEALIARIESHWPKRRRDGFYMREAPLAAGHDVSNDLAVDWQLAAILKAKSLARPGSVHAWRW